MEIIPQCGTCYKFFEIPDDLFKHFNQKIKCKPPKENVCCEFCTQKFNNDSDLQNHLNSCKHAKYAKQKNAKNKKSNCSTDEKTDENNDNDIEPPSPINSQYLNLATTPFIVVKPEKSNYCKMEKKEFEKAMEDEPDFLEFVNDVKTSIKEIEHDKFKLEVYLAREITMQKKVEQETMKIQADNQTLQAQELTKQLKLKLEILQIEKGLKKSVQKV